MLIQEGFIYTLYIAYLRDFTLMSFQFTNTLLSGTVVDTPYPICWASNYVLARRVERHIQYFFPMTSVRKVKEKLKQISSFTS